MRKLLLLLLAACTCLSAPAQGIYRTMEELNSDLKKYSKPGKERMDVLKKAIYSGVPTGRAKDKYSNELDSLGQVFNDPQALGLAAIFRALRAINLVQIERGDSLLAVARPYAFRAGEARLAGWWYATKATSELTIDNSACLSHYDSAIAIFKAHNFYNDLSVTYSNVAEAYNTNLSNYPKAMEHHLLAIQAAEKADVPERLGSSWLGAASTYTIIGDYDNALESFEKALTILRKADSTRYEALIQNNIGEMYRLMGKFSEAKEAYRLSNKYGPNAGNVAINESNLADVYMKEDSIDLAFKYAYSAREKFSQLGMTWVYSWVDGILARAYLKKGMTDSAIHYGRLGLQEARATETMEFVRDNAGALANAYAAKGDFANAYKYHTEYIQVRDSMLNTELRNKTSFMKYNADLEKQQGEIAKLEGTKKAQRNFLIGTIVVLTLIAIAAGLLIRNVRLKQRANQLLQKQKQEIDNKAKELATQKENIETLGEIGRRITSSLSINEIISTAYDNVNALMDASVFGIGIYNAATRKLEFPATYENGQALPAYANDVDDQNRFGSICFTTGKEIIMGDLHAEFESHLQSVPTPTEGEQPESIIFLPLIVKDKKLGVVTVQSFKKHAYTDYHLYMLRNIATYTGIALDNAESYDELSKTVESLKTTQAQLIQSEKMASLGELTAGIAHEIQNPLNFVNNFSDVNKELLEELKEELEKGNKAEVLELADSVIANQEKINHHGKRADGIVKSMLQHSRKGSGSKELTDLNALADEYLRLSYHGLRAKDKSFNADYSVQADTALQPLEVYPQELGRVILNLVNNAFYAAAQRAKAEPANSNYKPTVIIKTEDNDKHVTICVQDNGNGIPEDAQAKLFQPFFTTKPTGAGTGLGLSLSYDIMKAHGGDIQFKTQGGAGTTFYVRIPKQGKSDILAIA